MPDLVVEVESGKQESNASLNLYSSNMSTRMKENNNNNNNVSVMQT